MKISPLILLVSTTLAAQPPGGPPPDGGMARGPKLTEAQELASWLTLDRNQDGRLATDEIPERLRTVLTRGDADKDGILTRAELEAMIHRRFEAIGKSKSGPGGPPPGGGSRPPGPPPDRKQEPADSPSP